MKRYDNLFDKITSFNNILLASEKARKGKRYKRSTALFELNLEKNIWEIIKILREKSYKPGNYKDFFIYDPKKRLISAAPYKDRVIHHALMNVIGPLFEKTFVFDSYACIKNKGTHKAVGRYKHFMKRNRFVLKCDIKKYFQTIDHDILFSKVTKKVKCMDTLWLVKKIINSKPSNRSIDLFPGDDLQTLINRKTGIPIGNLTSQFFANLYLNDFDHFIKEQISAKYYIRYCDDFVIMDNSKKKLNTIKQEIIAHLAGLRLQLNPTKSRIFRLDEGVDFLGYRIFPDYSLVRKSIVNKYRRKIDKMRDQLLKGNGLPEKINCSIQSWIGHVKHANSFKLINELFTDIYSLLEEEGVKPRSPSRRLLEQY